MSILEGIMKRLIARRDKLVGAPPSPAPEDDADELIARGNQLESEGKLEEACACYQHAVVAAPGYGKAHLNLGIGLEAAGKPGPAAAAYRAALVVDSEDAFANYNLGKLRHSQGSAAEAEPLLRRAIASRPGFPEAHVLLASVLSDRDDIENAAEHLEAALHTRPDYVGALRNYADVLLKLNRPDDADAALRRAVEADSHKECAGVEPARSPAREG